ncbi:MAG: arylsulfatase [SAR86 cluster bacterium]|uniref:Arylsulfatase n=1 Tax=SAR86 cluster bacterium TaxID=2030880 RepID=A0A2A4XDB8_9GAMM|nr:MAG: arylsulfatase [SAR86 cluster bacterium]
MPRGRSMRRLVKPLLLLVVASLIAGVQAQDTQQPNFIVIMADDLGYGDLGVYGSQLIKTPNLDRMALEGARLDSFYSSANVCTAARGGLLTGRYPIRLDLVSDVARPTNDVHLAAEEISLAEALKPLGYQTALFGKWHLGSRLEWSPLTQGFDEYFGVLHSNDMTPLELYRQEQMIENPVNQNTLTERYTNEAIRFIENNQENPFFLYMPHTFPHVPLYVSNQFSGQSDAGLYGDVVETIDWSVGEVLATLDRLGLDENTIVIFTSDNGPWFEGSPGPFRDRKGSSWEGGQRVPFIAKWAGTIPGGLVSNEPAMNIDIFPTLLKLAGGDLPTDRPIDGKDILPMLVDGGASPHEVLYLFDNDRIVGVRSGQWKLVVESRYRAAVPSFDNPNSYYGPNGLLFDVQLDPSETYSFTREFPEVVEKMRELLLQGQSEFGSTVLPDMWNRPN